MTKYSPEYKLEVVKSVLEEGLSLKEAAEKFDVDRGEVQKWTAAYQAHGMSAIEKQRVSYPGEFNQQVVEDMQANKLSLRQTAAKYNLSDHSVVAKWERIYLEEGPQGLFHKRRGRSKSGWPPKLDKKLAEDLIAENQRLRMENEYLKKLNALVQERQRSERKKSPGNLRTKAEILDYRTYQNGRHST